MIVRLLIILNIVVFAMWSFSTIADPSFMIQNFLVSWSAVAQGRVWTLFTSMFSHNMFLHILINMFVLNSFGPVLENILGSWSFLKFYLVAGVISSLSHAVVSNWILHEPGLPALGASGSIAGVILVFSLIFPKEKILLLGFIPMPAIVGALAFIGLDLWGLSTQAEGGGLPIGHGAHLGGAFTGIIFYLFSVRGRIKSRGRPPLI